MLCTGIDWIDYHNGVLSVNRLSVFCTPTSEAEVRRQRDVTYCNYFCILFRESHFFGTYLRNIHQVREEYYLFVSYVW